MLKKTLLEDQSFANVFESRIYDAVLPAEKNLSNYRVFFVQLKNRLTLHCLKRLEDQTKVGDHKIGLNSNDVGQIDLNMYGATQLVVSVSSWLSFA